MSLIHLAPPPSPSSPPALAQAHAAICACTLCPRLRLYGENIGRIRRRAYIDQTYWARPVPGFGDPRARILILGLAPGAHGANRTGRPFTGDGAGYFMYPVLHSVGLATQPLATIATDGLRLRDAFIASVVRCAPPADKPTPAEVRTCAHHLHAELAGLPRLRVVVCLGKIAWDAYLATLLAQGVIARRSAYPFAHAAEHALPNGLTLLGSYHPSLRNTNTGRLNIPMFTRIFIRARELATTRRPQTALVPHSSTAPPSMSGKPISVPHSSTAASSMSGKTRPKLVKSPKPPKHPQPQSSQQKITRILLS